MKHCKIQLLVVLAIVLQACSGGNDSSSAPDAAAAAGPRVVIISPANGSTVTSPVTVEFGIEEFSLAPAGTYADLTGHHHLLIDTSLPTLDQPIPSDGNHVHFGKAQTSTVIELAPGEHKLQLLLGDGNHVPHAAPLISEPVTITVVAETVK